ncbi:MAG: hypothetical protein B6I19_08990, partial [Bacteroidetes bacterium 4572_114]
DYDAVDVSLCGSSFDTKLEVWYACDDGTWAYFNDDSGECNTKALQSFITTGPMLDGETWYAKVYGYGSNFGDYILEIAGPPVPWLQIAPEMGTINPGDPPSTMDVMFSAESVGAGIYNAEIVFTSNDPVTPTLAVPVQLIVGALTQEIIMPEGWNAWSSYINPDMRMGMEEVMAPVLDQMIITQHFSELFYPEFGINTMGDFTNAHGYVSKMTEEAVLPITGFMADAR